MQLINHNNTICLEFLSNSKIIKKSLNLTYNEKNLKYAKNTLLPIFKKLYLVKIKSPLKQISKKQSPKNGSKLLSQICNHTLQSLHLHSKKTTLKSASYAYKRVFDFLADKPINSYSHDEIQTAIFKMQEASLSPKTIHLIVSYLNLAFKTAQISHFTNQNPIRLIKKPRILKSQKNIPTKNEIKILLNNSSNELKRFLYIAFYTGARSGEILALKKDDINFQNSYLNINKNQTRYELTTPKNGDSRIVLMPKNLSIFLKTDLLNQKDEKLFTKDYFQIYYEFKKLLKKLNYKSLGLHIARHFYTTLLLKNKISPIFIAKNLGHTNLTQIHKTYSHYFFDKKEILAVEKVMKF